MIYFVHPPFPQLGRRYERFELALAFATVATFGISLLQLAGVGA